MELSFIQIYNFVNMLFKFEMKYDMKKRTFAVKSENDSNPDR